MNDIEKIKCIEELNKRKKQLQFELIATNKKIDALEKNCNHLNVNLGQDKYRCILCEKENAKTGYIINAEKYLLHYDVDDRFECNKKFEVIKTLAKKIMQETLATSFNENFTPDIEREVKLDEGILTYKLKALQ